MMTVNRNPIEIRRLGQDDLDTMDALLTMFGDVFDEQDTYSGRRPRPAYLSELLANDMFIALVALGDGKVVGGLAAYVLPKFEQDRREIYIYDLAVDAGYRRQGIATSLIEEVRRIASTCGAWVVFVQADRGDEPAVALYTKLGVREDVLHFDIEPGGGSSQ